MIDLTPFLATEHDTRGYLRAPWRCPEGVCATNGHVLVCVRDDGGQHADAHKGMPEVVAKFRAYLDQPGLVWTEVAGIELLEVPACRACDGKGHNHFVECEDCDGDGTFDHGQHTYECKECRGEGRVKTSEKSEGAKKESCWRCDGTGLGFGWERVAEVLIQTKYLQLLKALPGCLIGTAGPLDTVAVRFDGGFGAVMPCRDRA